MLSLGPLCQIRTLNWDIYMYIHLRLLSLISMLWHRQAIFESEGDNLEPNIQQTECPLTNRLSYRGSSKNFNSTARPNDQRANMHTYMHACIHAYIHTYIHTYILLVIFAWICCDGFESQLRNGYLLKCDCLLTVIDILVWSNEKQRLTF